MRRCAKIGLHNTVLELYVLTLRGELSTPIIPKSLIMQRDGIHGLLPTKIKLFNSTMKKHYFIILLTIFTFMACTNDESKENLILQPGNYGFVVSVGVSGGSNSVNTKAIVDDRFTDEYDANYIYLHSIDNPDKVLRFPVQEEEDVCGPDCKGFRIYTHVEDNGDVMIFNYDPAQGESTSEDKKYITLNAEENIYFSSQESDIWQATRVEDEVSPLSQQPVFIRDENKNIELYRSAKNYTANGSNDGLVSSIGAKLQMDRVCSAYQVRCVVTDLDNDVNGDGSYFALNEESFESQTGTERKDWSIKLYLGPLFPYTYNLSKIDPDNRVSYGEENTGGYYVTNRQSYTELAYPRQVVSSTSAVEDNSKTYRGLGLVTTEEYVITPVDESTEGTMTAYVFIKYNPSENADNKSDEGAKYAIIPVEDLPGRTNYTEQVNIVIDIDALVEAFQNEISGASQPSVPNGIFTKNLFGGELEQINLDALVFCQ